MPAIAKRKPPKRVAKKAPTKRVARVRNVNGESVKTLAISSRTQNEILTEVKRSNPNMTAAEYASESKLDADSQWRFTGFALEYVKDMNMTKAAMRMGFPAEVAPNTGRIYLFNTFTQLLLSEWVKVATTDMIVSEQQVIQRLWEEANAADVPFSSNASTRIAALGLLSKILMLGVPKASTEKSYVPSGVMLVPIAMNPDQWEEHTRNAQRKLKHEVTLDV